MRQSRNKLNVFSLLRHCRQDEISFDIVAETGNSANVAGFGDVAVFGDIVAGVDGALSGLKMHASSTTVLYYYYIPKRLPYTSYVSYISESWTLFFEVV